MNISYSNLEEFNFDMSGVLDDERSSMLESLPHADPEQYLEVDEENQASLPDYERSWKPSFQPENIEEARKALAEFIPGRVKRYGLNEMTGLPRYLFGNLQQSQGDVFETASQFLKSNSVMLTSKEEETLLTIWRHSYWEEGWQQLTFAQINNEGVPIYGGHIATDFAADRLVWAHSNLFPVKTENLDDLIWQDPYWIHSPEIIEVQAFERPLDLRQDENYEGLADRWIFPYFVEGMEEGIYRPVWRTHMADYKGNHWLILVDAENAEEINILARWSLTVEAGTLANVYSSSVNAMNQDEETRWLNYGNGDYSMTNANKVHMKGPRFNDPPDLLSATAYYHAYHGQNRYRNFILPGVGLSLPAGAISPLENIDVYLEDQGGDARYEPINGKHAMRFFTGKDGPFPVQDPGMDGEVIYHELTHAFLRFWNSAVFQYNYDSLREAATRKLDEGLAFYFACDYGGNPRWAEYAYQSWQDHRDLANEPADPSEDESSETHKFGMKWARCFWELRDNLGFSANRLILRAFSSLGGSILDREEFAVALIAQAELIGEQDLVTSILISGGFTQ